jgi:putative salt-induced outer membrane protein YdiY
MRMRLRNIPVALLLLSFVSARAGAQAPAPPPPDHETSAELSFVGTGGNSSTETIGVGGSRLDRVDSWLVTSKAAYVRNNSDGVLKAESIALVFQGAKILTPKLSVFGRYGFLHDRFAGIESRNTVGAGVAYTFLETKDAKEITRTKLTVDGALGYASEERTISPTLKNGIGDMGLLYDWKLSDTAEVTDDARLVLSLSDGKDWRAGNIVTVSAKMTAIFSLKLSNTVRYVNQPVPGFKTTDTVTAIALVAKF